MSKGSLIFFSLIYLTVYSAIATALGVSASEVGSLDNLTTPTDIFTFGEMVGEFFSTLWNLLTFNVVGVHSLVILFTVYPAVVAIVVGVVWLIRG